MISLENEKLKATIICKGGAQRIRRIIFNKVLPARRSIILIHCVAGAFLNGFSELKIFACDE